MLVNIERSRQFYFHTWVDDLYTVPKRIAGVSKVLHNTLFYSVGPILGYSVVVPSKGVNSMTAFLVNNAKRAENFPVKTCH